MAVLLELISFFALWMLFVFQLDKGEIYVGLAAASLAVIAFETAKRAEPIRFRPPAAALAQVWRVPGLILQGTWVLVQELAKQILGHRARSQFQLAPFRAVGADARSSAKRVLAIIYVTLPPNSLIIGIDRESKLMLYHQVRKEPVPAIIRRLETA